MNAQQRNAYFERKKAKLRESNPELFENIQVKAEPWHASVRVVDVERENSRYIHNWFRRLGRNT